MMKCGYDFLKPFLNGKIFNYAVQWCLGFISNCVRFVWQDAGKSSYNKYETRLVKSW